MKPEIKQIFLDRIDIDHSPKVRSECNDEALKEYTHQYKKDKSVMPPIVLFSFGSGPLLLGDGLHRYHSMIAAGIKVAQCEIREGNFEACLKFALRANLSHGLRRTNEDKRIAVKLALVTFPKYSNVQISDIAAVGDALVADVRKSMEVNGDIEKHTVRIGKDGREQNAKVAGRRGVVKNDPSRPQNIQNKGKYEETKTAGVVLSGGGSNGSHGKADVVLDETGYPIPEKSMEVWVRRVEVQVCINNANTIKEAVERAWHDGEDPDPLFFGKGKLTQNIITDLQALIRHLKSALPYAVCPYCQGKLVEKCAMCSRTGMISLQQLGAVPEELRKVREKAIEKLSK